MDEHTRIIIGVRLEKAKDDIATAHDLIALGRLRGAVNRAYYAIYHLATAVLLTQDIERSKHCGVQSAFGQYLVQPGLIETEYGWTEGLMIAEGLRPRRKGHRSETSPNGVVDWRILTSARKARETSDYADRIELDEETAQRIVADAGRTRNGTKARGRYEHGDSDWVFNTASYRERYC